jgi:F-type H+-transporting ATPase subunit gamma
MPSAREMRLRIRSVKNIGQVTRALQAVSASKVRRAMQANSSTRPYSEKAWKVLLHLARQPGHSSLHPLLSEREHVDKVLVLMITSDRGLAGASNVNVLRHTLEHFRSFEQPIAYVPVGRKGRDLLWRRRRDILAEFSNLPSPPSFLDVSAIGRLLIDEYLSGRIDRVYLAYNEFGNMIRQDPVVRKLLPLEVEFVNDEQSNEKSYNVTHAQKSVFIYEPDQSELLDQIVPRFTRIQVFQAILSAQASEHAARMVSMRNATENAAELAEALQLEYNKARQQTITNDLLDIAGGAEALMQQG